MKEYFNKHIKKPAEKIKQLTGSMKERDKVLGVPKTSPHNEFMKIDIKGEALKKKKK